MSSTTLERKDRSSKEEMSFRAVRQEGRDALLKEYLEDRGDGERRGKMKKEAGILGSGVVVSGLYTGRPCQHISAFWSQSISRKPTAATVTTTTSSNTTIVTKRKRGNSLNSSFRTHIPRGRDQPKLITKEQDNQPLSLNDPREQESSEANGHRKPICSEEKWSKLNELDQTIISSLSLSIYIYIYIGP